MKKITQKSRIPLPEFQTGQVWQLENSNIHIGLTGKTLVHYKHYKAGVRRAPVSLAGKIVLEKYLVENEAVLVQPRGKGLPWAACPSARAEAASP